MAEINETMNVATETTESVPMEFDQPEERDEVSLAELLGEEQPVEGQGEEQEGAPAEQTANAGDASPQTADKKQEKLLTQADFDRAFGERAAGLRRQWEREHAEELAIARTIRQRYQGKSVAEIEEALIAEEAKTLALDAGYSDEEALQKVRARHAYERQSSNEVDPALLAGMARQMDEFQAKYGIDLQAEIEADQSLIEAIGDDGDMKDLMIAVLAKKGAPARPAGTKANHTTTQKPTAPRVETAGAAPSAQAARVLTDAEIERIDRELSQGRYVRI